MDETNRRLKRLFGEHVFDVKEENLGEYLDERMRLIPTGKLEAVSAALKPKIDQVGKEATDREFPIAIVVTAAAALTGAAVGYVVYKSLPPMDILNNICQGVMGTTVELANGADIRRVPHEYRHEVGQTIGNYVVSEAYDFAKSIQGWVSGGVTFLASFPMYSRLFSNTAVDEAKNSVRIYKGILSSIEPTLERRRIRRFEKL